MTTGRLRVRDLEIARHVDEVGDLAELGLELMRTLVQSRQVEALHSVNWYKLFVSWPPIRIGGGFCRKTRIPGMAANFGLSSWMT